jgi:hypothetical protein
MERVKDKRQAILSATLGAIIKNFPQEVLNILTLDVATSLAQKQADGQFTLTDELIEQVIDTSWEAIRA